MGGAEEPRVFGGAVHDLRHGHGPLLAILLDQKIRAEGVLRTIYPYPMAICSPSPARPGRDPQPVWGIEKVMHQMGWDELHL